jgi:hypothetical protein
MPVSLSVILLPIYLFVCLSFCLYIFCLYIILPVYLFVCMSFCLSIFLFVYFSVCLYVRQYISLPVYLCLHICLSISLLVYPSFCLPIRLLIAIYMTVYPSFSFLSFCPSSHLLLCLSVCLSVCLTDSLVIHFYFCCVKPGAYLRTEHLKGGSLG